MNSSDIDLEQASVLEDIKDLTLVSEHQTRSSPMEPSIPRVARHSRNNSRSSSQGGHGKIVVFKDEKPPGRPEDTKCSGSKDHASTRKALRPKHISVEQGHHRNIHISAFERTETSPFANKAPRSASDSNLDHEPTMSNATCTMLHIRSAVEIARELQSNADEKEVLLRRIEALNSRDAYLANCLLHMHAIESEENESRVV